MGSWLDGLSFIPLAAVLGAYLFGVGTGWLLWSGSKTDIDLQPGDSRTKTATEKAADSPEGASKIEQLEAELKEAQAMLAAVDENDGRLSSEIDELDNAVKRANGRLKLIMKAVRKARPDG